MTPTWADRASPASSGDLRALYTQVPSLTDVTIHHIRLLRLGPTVTLRLDLPLFPDNPPPEWKGLDRLQLNLRFLAVDGLSLTGSELPVTATIALTDLPANRVSATVTGGVEMAFTASATLLVSKLSARLGDNASQSFLNRLDRRLYTEVPGPEVESFHDR